MLSRRSVRVKVMQLLYMLNRDESLTFPDMIKLYNEGIWQAFELYIFHLHLIRKIAEYAEKDAENRAKKLLPSDEDKLFTPRFFRNDGMRSLAEHTEFLGLVEKYGFNKDIDEDHIRILYQNFTDSEKYATYMAIEEPTAKETAKVYLELYKYLVKSELFREISEDRYANWEDDESLVIGGIKRTLKAMPLEGEFYKNFEPSDETVRDFGEQLLRKVCQEDAILFQHIEPMLKNWDADRVAILDMIMLKMGLCELINFETIPTKVTINEFIEISKQYSTDKSKDFVNGVLDRLMKKLDKEDKIQKEGRGLVG